MGSVSSELSPPSRRLFVDPSAGARLRTVREFLSAGDAARETLLLAHTHRAGADLARSLAVRDGGLFGLRVASLAQLTRDLAERATGRVAVGPLATRAVVARAIALEGEVEPFEFFDEVADSPGFLRAVERTLAECRLSAVTAAELEDLGGRGRDLARCLARFESELHDRFLLDRSLCFELAAEALHDDSRWRRVAILDTLPGSIREADVLAAIVGSAESVVWVAPPGDTAALRRAETAIGTGSETGRSRGDGRLGGVRVRLFEGSAEDEIEAPDDSFELFSAPGEGQETVEIARRIVGFAAEGSPYHRIAVLLRSPSTYQPLVEESFSRAGIPGYWARGVIRPDPTGRAFLALLSCAEEDLSARRFAEFLSLGQLPAADTGGAPPVREVPWVEPDEEGRQLVFTQLLGRSGEPSGEGLDTPVVAGTLRAPRHWERLIVEASVVGGLDRWARRLGGLARELEARVAGPHRDETSRRRAEEALARLRDLERYALPLLEDLAELPRPGGLWGEWIERLEVLASRSVRDPERVLAVLAELRPMADVGPVSLVEVRRVLEERLTELRVSPGGTGHGRVFVGSIDEARGRSFDVVFVPGLAEGVFPRRLFEDPILLDEHRRSISDDLPQREDRAVAERQLLRIAVGAAERHLVASYPTLDTNQGRSRVPSFYALDLVRAAEGEVPDQKVLERQAASASALRQGWPAPDDPVVAIDEAEFDLAILDPLMRVDPESAVGRGRFLLAANDCLARSLRARGRRWRNFFSDADGVVEPDTETLAVLATQRLSARPYSPTALQAFAGCPYRFVLHALHRLRPREPIAQLVQMDPMTRGRLFHEVQATLLRELDESGRLPWRPGDVDDVANLAESVLEEVASRYADELVPAIDRVWADEVESMRVDLRGWIADVAERPGSWRPAYFELAFGLPPDSGRDPRSRDEPVVLEEGRVRLRGAIDLVEVDEAGQHLRVTDHKTGRAPSGDVLVVGGGEKLQPLLYALAAEAMLGLPALEGRLSYCTRRGGYKVLGVPLGPYQGYELRDALEIIDHAVTTGFLPAAPSKGACTYCDYRSVCGPYEEARTGRKQSDALADLARLRSKL